MFDRFNIEPAHVIESIQKTIADEFTGAEVELVPYKVLGLFQKYTAGYER